MIRTAMIILMLMLTSAAVAAAPDEESVLAPPAPVLCRGPVEVGSVAISEVDVSEINSVAVVPIDELLCASRSGPTFIRRSIEGTFIASAPQEGAEGTEGCLDIVWCGTYAWGSWCQWVRAFNLSGGFEGYFWGPEFPNEGLAFDGTSWYCSRADQRLWLGQWNGMWGSTPIWASVTDPIPNLSGIAADNTNDCLWITQTDRILQRRAKDGTFLSQFQLSLDYGTPKACAMTQTNEYGYSLAITYNNDPLEGRDWLVFYDVSDTVVETTTWGSIKAMFR